MACLNDGAEKNMGKRENAGKQNFLLWPLCSEKSYLQGSLKVDTVWNRVKMKISSH